MLAENRITVTDFQCISCEISLFNFNDYGDHGDDDGSARGLPKEGEFIVIKKGDTIVLDVSTPTLEFILVQGELIFEPDAAEVSRL